MKIIVMFGPPGAGKGTQAEILSKKLNLMHISTGEILREEIEKKSDIGNIVKNRIEKGELASDEIIMKVFEKHISESSAKGFIIDGIPRNVNQAELFLALFKQRSVKDIEIINLGAHEEELLKRLIKRAQLEKRKDDKKITIEKRFKIYDKVTKPVLDYLKDKEVKIYDIDGVGSIERIHKDILKSLS